MRSDDIYKLVVRAYDRGNGRFITKFDYIIASGHKNHLEPVKLLLENLDNGNSFTRRVEYRKTTYRKEYFIMPWGDELPESKEPAHDNH